ncbi:MAG: hypothetical protein WCL44_09510 [bacterium]
MAVHGYDGQHHFRFEISTVRLGGKGKVELAARLADARAELRRMTANGAWAQVCRSINANGTA